MESQVLAGYVEGCRSSSHRARLVVLITAITSVVAFSAYWNSRTASWIQARVEVAAAMAEQERPWRHSSPCRFSSEETSAPTHAERAKWTQQIAPYKFMSGKELSQRMLLLEDARIRSMLLVSVPLLGCTFDVNDLGLFGGLAFLILLFWLMYSLGRDRDNLALVFGLEDLSKEQRTRLYQLLSMHQVLSVPPVLQRPVHTSFTSMIPRLLYILPLVVQALVVGNDATTMSRGFMTSGGATVAVIAAEWTCLVPIAVMTVLCVSRSLAIDRIWRGAAEKIVASAGGRK